jgi:hypothetical protein
VGLGFQWCLESAAGLNKEINPPPAAAAAPPAAAAQRHKFDEWPRSCGLEVDLLHSSLNFFATIKKNINTFVDRNMNCSVINFQLEDDGCNRLNGLDAINKNGVDTSWH